MDTGHSLNVRLLHTTRALLVILSLYSSREESFAQVATLIIILRLWRVVRIVNGKCIPDQQLLPVYVLDWLQNFCVPISLGSLVGVF